MFIIWHLVLANALFVTLVILTKVITVVDFPPCNVGLEAFVEVMGADTSVDDSQDNEHDGNDGEGREGFACWEIHECTRMLVHAYKLEKEVC